MDRVRDHHALTGDPAAIADLLDLRVNEQVRVTARKRSGAERLDLLVQAGANARHLAAAHSQPEALDQLVDAAGRDPAHVRLRHDRDHRLLGALARPQKRREGAALTQLGDLQLDLPSPRVPAPGPIPVAMRSAILRPALTQLRADQLRNLGLHQLLSNPAHTLAHNIGVALQQNLPDDLLDRHSLRTGHQRCLLRRRTVRSPTTMSAAMAGTTPSTEIPTTKTPVCKPRSSRCR